MTIQKLSGLGLPCFLNQPVIPGLSGTNALTGATVNPPANEISITAFLLSGAAITLNGTTATVTLAGHGFTINGQFVTYSGATGVTAINGQTWGPITITSSSVYTFPCSLTGTVTGTIIQEPVYPLPQGYNVFRLGANAQVEYNPDNTYTTVNGIATPPTWRILIAASGVGSCFSDGFQFRLHCNGTTATSLWSVGE